MLIMPVQLLRKKKKKSSFEDYYVELQNMPKASLA